MLAMTGFFERFSSFQIRSLASAEPPGLSTRKTIALTVESFSAWRMASTMVSEPMYSPPTIDQPLLVCLAGRVGAIVDQLLHPDGGELPAGPAGHDPADDLLLIEIVEDTGELLAVGLRQALAGERLGGTLEVAHLDEVGLDAE